MRRLFTRRRSLYPLRSCHFCCVDSWIVPPHPQQNDDGSEDLSSTVPSSSTGPQISTGSVSNWYCSSCQCWNRADANQVGGIATWEQKMSNEQQNIDSLQKRATLPASSSNLSISSSSRFPTTSPFCHSCQTNQTLILSILANGDTDDMDDAATQQWQTSLHARYPPVCDQCRVMVEDRIENADKMARRLIWNGWLRRSREKGAVSSPRRDTNRQDTPPEVKVDTMQSWAGICWGLQGSAFALGFILDIAFAIRKRPYIESKEQFVLFAGLLASHQIALSWDPTYLRRVRLNRRLSPRTIIKVNGLGRLQLLQFSLLIMRLFHLLCSPISSMWLSDIHTKTAITLLYIIVQGWMTIYAFSRIRLLEPHSISLKSRTKVSLESPEKGNRPASNGDPAFDLLSLDTIHRSRAQQEQLADESAVEAAANVEEMDWSPTPDVSLIGSDFQLGPQRFFEPVRKTGLEELLHMQLALDEGKKVRKEEEKSKNRKVVIAGCAIAFTTLLVAVAAVKLGPTQISAAFDQVVAHYMPHQSQPSVL